MLSVLKFQFSADNRTGSGFSALKNDLKGVKGALAGVQDYARRSGRAMRNIGAGMSAGVTAPMLLLGRQSLQLYDQQVKAEKTVAQAITSTGGAAGKTLQDLKGLASGLQGLTTFGDENILQNVTAPLLTFTKIQGETFDRAQANVLDMATLLKMDLKSASILVGKALNDPIKGISALGRSGVQFSEDQKKVIKALVETGDTAAAQALILEELETQFKGQAAAAASTPLGKWEQLSNMIGDVKEELGAQITPFLLPLAEKLKEAVQWFAALSPEVKRNIVIFGGLAAAVGPILGILGLATMGIGALTGAFATMGAVLMANPIFAAIAAIAAGAYLIYRNWEGISGWFAAKWAAISSGARAGWDAIKSTLNEYSPQWLKDLWGGLAGWFGLQWAAVRAGITIAWDGVKGLLSGTYSPEQLIYSAWRGIGTWFSGLTGEVVQGFKDIWEGVKAEVSSWPGRMIQYGRDIVGGLVSGIKENFGAAEESGRTLGSRVRRGLTNDTKIQSPSKVFMGYGKNIVEGLAQGIGQNGQLATAELGKITEGLKTTGQTAAQQLGPMFANAFTSIVSGTGKAKDALAGLARQVISMAANKAFTSLFNHIFDGFSWFGGGSTGSATANAKGNAFAGGNVIPFAAGGVVSRATTFPMAGGRTGLMGEAGPEAIMPLSRGSDGKLGVRAAGGGATVVQLQVNIENRVQNADVSVRQSEGRLDVVVRDLMRDEVSSGGLDRPLDQRYGLRAKAMGL